MKFKVGDIVIKEFGEYQGYVFKVTAVWGNGLSVCIESENGFINTEGYWWSVANFRKLSKLEKALK